MGVYGLIEKIKFSGQRVSLPQNVQGMKGMRDQFLFKKDYVDPKDKGFVADGFGALVWVSPKEERVKKLESEELQRRLRVLWEAVLDTESNRDPEKHFSRYLDVHSWMTYHWLNMLAKNSDGLLASSYFSSWSTPESFKVAAGPIWDFDRSMGSLDGKDQSSEGWSGTGKSSQYLDDPRTPIWGAMLKDPDFRQQRIDYWQRNRKTVLSFENIDRILTHFALELNRKGPDIPNQRIPRSPADRNFQKWSEVPPRGGSHLAEVEILRSWLKKRLVWIDQQFTQPPSFSLESGKITQNTVIELHHDADEVFYTLDGSDPRSSGGQLNPNANSGATVRLTESAIVTARARKGKGITSWSSPVTATFVITDDER